MRSLLRVVDFLTAKFGKEGELPLWMNYLYR
jgi:hypothetical protein